MTTLPVPGSGSTSRSIPVYPAGLPASRWGIAEEVPVEIGFNGQAWTVMMASPADIEDLACGLALTEGAIVHGADIERIEVREWPEGITADIILPPARLRQDHIRRRSLDGRTGCGLCGIETLAELQAAPPVPTASPAIAAAAILSAFTALPALQTLNRETRSVHAAAWCRADGSIVTVREDVGRHNALDKLAGARLRLGEPADPGFVIMSSRCSFELVFKAARLGAAVLATQSAPTGRALDLAVQCGLSIATAGPDGQIVFFTPEPVHG